MKIGYVLGNYIYNTQKLAVPKISFGEYDGDFYDSSSRKNLKEQYELKREMINEKYDRIRSSLLRDCDYLEISNPAIYNRLNQIEKQREIDLAELNNVY